MEIILGRGQGTGSLGITVLFLLASGAGWPAFGAAEPLRAQELVFAANGERQFRLSVKTNGQVPVSSCRIEGEGATLMILELPLIESALKPTYEFPGMPVGEVKVASTSGPKGKGIRVEVPLKAAILRGWESGPEGIKIYLGSSAGGGGHANAIDPYHLGNGDRLEISVFGHDDLHKELEVLADGTVIFPVAGIMPVAGKTVAEVRVALEQKLKEFLVDPQVSLDIKEYLSQPVNVVGEVKTPGKYFLKGPTSLIDILAQAGWMTQDAGSNIIVTRHESSPGGPGDGVRQILVRKEDLVGGSGSFNIPIQTGDVVTVGPRQYFYIRGEVAHPGQYPLENSPTLLKAMSIAGGLNPFAKRKGIELLRTVNGVQTKKVLDLKAIEDREIEDIPLMADDVILVPRRLF